MCVGRWLKNERKEGRKWQETKGGGVNIYYDDPDGSCMCVSEVVRLTSSSPEDAGAAQG